MTSQCGWGRLLCALVAVCLLGWAVPASGQVRELPAGPAANDHGNNYILSFRAGTSQAEREQIVGLAGAQLRFNYTIVDAAAVTVPNVNALASLQQHPAIERVTPDRPVYALQGKGKPGGGGGGGEVVPEGVKRVGAGDAGGAGIGVAIVDTGIDLAHTDLSVGASNFDAYGGSCQDGEGHGTHVSGIVAALLGNNTGVVGVAPDATPYCVRVLDNSGRGTDSTIMAGLDWVYANRNSVTPNIRVVNMSLGREGSLNDNPDLRASVAALYNAGVVVVVAAGNTASAEVKDMIPAGYPEVLAVASTSAKAGTNACSRFNGVIGADTASYFTTDGKLDANNIGVTISAPGEDQENINKACFISSTGILSLKAGGGTTRMSGTSMASPHVAGIVARMIESGLGGLNAAGVEQIRSNLRGGWRVLSGTAPLNNPASSYSYDGEREGIARIP